MFLIAIDHSSWHRPHLKNNGRCISIYIFPKIMSYENGVTAKTDEFPLVFNEIKAIFMKRLKRKTCSERTGSEQ